ncbi:putative non-specific serine/threonine protein kinase [Helianthus annuus]|nr:putative non-specific serine/threonine protein kinase [Helianthus annuus]KAJ0921173.1 putative non-specific serine/threonine protein kinase [Helianthus annuus]
MEFVVLSQFSQAKGLIFVTCLKGFVPHSNDEWGKGNWTRGCVRRNELVCEKNETKPDQLQVLRGIKLPDHYHYFPYRDTDECQQLCLGNLLEILNYVMFM